MGVIFGATHSLAQEIVPLVSKTIDQVFPLDRMVFAFDESGKNFSRLNLFTTPPEVINGAWPYLSGGVEGGVPRKDLSLILRGSYRIGDSLIVRVASLAFDARKWKSDSLIFPIPSNSKVKGAGLTAMALWQETLILGFGRLGLGIVPLAPHQDAKLFLGNTADLSILPTASDSSRPWASCTWNQVCRIDTLSIPSGGTDSIIALAIDSSAVDSIWLLVATQAGMRRGLLGTRSFPRITLPASAPVVVNRLVVAPAHRLAWAFTGAHVYFSDDHGKSFHEPPTISGLQTKPADLTGFSQTPELAFFGDSTFVNFNFVRPGLVVFRKDSLQRSQGTGPIGDVLVDKDDSLDMEQGKGSLTGLCITRQGNEAILVLGTSIKGLLYRKLSANSPKTFLNINRLRTLKNSLGEVIIYPTLFSGELVEGVPEQMRVGYHLKRDGKVTITVFNYAMEKVRVLVRNVPRRGGIARSEEFEDRWDGRDSGGRRVSVGTYYILVESDQGERGFGKALVVRGRD